MNDKLRKSLLFILRQLVKPIVKFCLNHSLKVQDLIEAVKSGCVDVAKAELSKQSEQPSASRISAMTGIHRRDVVRLMAEEPDEKHYPSLITRVISQWRYDERFLTKSGRPRALKVEGKKSEFAELVKSVSKDLSAYAILFELERLGYVQRSNDRLKLCARMHVSVDDLEEGFLLLSEDAEDLLAAVEENVLNKPEIPNLHLKTDFDNICPDYAADIRHWLLEEGSAFHKKANEYLAQFDLDTNKKLAQRKGGMRVGLGSFSRISNAET